MTRSQLLAFVLSMLVQFGFLILAIGEYIFEPGPLHSLSSHVSVITQLGEYSKGVIDLRRLVFNATLVGLGLFLTVRIVDSWRWD